PLSVARKRCSSCLLQRTTGNGQRTVQKRRSRGRVMANVNRRILPGFYSSLGFTLVYLTALVLIPLGACCVKAASLSPAQFWAAVWNERARAAYALTFGASLSAASANVFLGLLLAWLLVRYEF